MAQSLLSWVREQFLGSTDKKPTQKIIKVRPAQEVTDQLVSQLDQKLLPLACFCRSSDNQFTRDADGNFQLCVCCNEKNVWNVRKALKRANFSIVPRPAVNRCTSESLSSPVAHRS